jgi:hypothetical protein
MFIEGKQYAALARRDAVAELLSSTAQGIFPGHRQTER